MAIIRKIEYELNTLINMLQAGVDALNEIESQEGLSKYGLGYRDAKVEVIERLKKIRKEAEI